jgi:hypothetical protein
VPRLRTIIIATALTLVSPAATAAPVVTAATIRIVITSPTNCEVTMALRLEGASEIEHRIESFDGSDVELRALNGARSVGSPRQVGRTRVVTLQLDRPDYELRYRASQSADRIDRCPLWIPAAPTTGQLETVRIDVQLPDGSRPSGTMPALAWTGSTGTTTIGHVPAFVRAPYASPGESVRWDLLQVMDAATVAIFAAASGIWVWRRRRVRARHAG